jgi:hypothetical protein
MKDHQDQVGLARIRLALDRHHNRLEPACGSPARFLRRWRKPSAAHACGKSLAGNGTRRKDCSVLLPTMT